LLSAFVESPLIFKKEKVLFLLSPLSFIIGFFVDLPRQRHEPIENFSIGEKSAGQVNGRFF